MPARVAAAALTSRLRADQLVRNSLLLLLSSALQAGLGFAFWAIGARLFSPAAVGRASSLVSALTVIAYLALLGLNAAIIRRLPTARDPQALITAALLLVGGCGAGLGLLYVLLIPVAAPRLAFVADSPALAAGFVAAAAAAAVSLLADAVFVASRRAGLCALTDGGVGGTVRVAAVALCAGTGAAGLFLASAAGVAAAAGASVAVLLIALHWRPSGGRPRRARAALRPLLWLSGANYTANVLNLLPALVLPVIVLNRLGAAAAAYYFVAFQVASLLYATAYAVEQAFHAEGSQAGADRTALRRRSRHVLLTLCLPPCLVLAAAAHWILLVFGASYSEHGTAALAVLAVAAVPVAASNWLWTALRLSGQLRALVLSNGVYAITICGLAWLLAPYGLAAVAAAWLAGGVLAAAAAAWPERAAAGAPEMAQP